MHFARPTYCYLRGPHYHWYTPPPQAQFELKGGAYWYVGTYDPVYYDERPRYAVVNDAYTPLTYARPVIDVRVAPPAFHGEIVAVAPGLSAGVYVGTPGPPPRPGAAGRRRNQPGRGAAAGGDPRTDRLRARPAQSTAGTDRGIRRAVDGGARRPRRRIRLRGWRGNPPPVAKGGWRGNPSPHPAPGGWHGGVQPARHENKHGKGGWHR